jgi:hypothetical protein
MTERLTWNEIISQFPDEWVSIIDPEYQDNSSEFKTGIVIGHNVERNKAFSEYKKQLDSGLKCHVHTFRFTGEIPLIAGLNKLVIADAQALKMVAYI